MPERIRHEALDKNKIREVETEIRLVKDQCKGCGYCIEYCPQKVLEESKEINAKGVHPPRVADQSKCKNCGFCTAVCPDFAIFVVEKTVEKENKHA